MKQQFPNSQLFSFSHKSPPLEVGHRRTRHGTIQQFLSMKHMNAFKAPIFLELLQQDRYSLPHTHNPADSSSQFPKYSQLIEHAIVIVHKISKLIHDFL
jgi:hypothetical protein